MSIVYASDPKNVLYVFYMNFIFYLHQQRSLLKAHPYFFPEKLFQILLIKWLDCLPWKSYALETCVAIKLSVRNERRRSVNCVITSSLCFATIAVVKLLRFARKRNLNRDRARRLLLPCRKHRNYASYRRTEDSSSSGEARLLCSGSSLFTWERSVSRGLINIQLSRENKTIKSVALRQTSWKRQQWQCFIVFYVKQLVTEESVHNN